MDAVRLVAETERALAAARDETRIMAECWQAQILACAVGGRLALTGPPALREEALGLAEAGGRESVLPAVGATAGGVRAARLTAVADPAVALAILERLLESASAALVAVATSAQEDGAYWQCMEAIDAADDARDRVRRIRRRLGPGVSTRGDPAPGPPPEAPPAPGPGPESGPGPSAPGPGAGFP